MAGVEPAGFQERHTAVKFHTVDIERGVGDAQRLTLTGVEVPLVGDVMNGQHGRNVGSVPSHIRGGQPARPVVRMHDIRQPIQTAASRGDVRSRQRKAGEPQVIILPVGTLLGAVGGAAPVEQCGRCDQIQYHPIRQPNLAQARREYAGSARQIAKPVNVR
jgi:hypothetical protein